MKVEREFTGFFLTLCAAASPVSTTGATSVWAVCRMSSHSHSSAWPIRASCSTSSSSTSLTSMGLGSQSQTLTSTRCAESLFDDIDRESSAVDTVAVGGMVVKHDHQYLSFSKVKTEAAVTSYCCFNLHLLFLTSPPYPPPPIHKLAFLLSCDPHT